MFCRVETKTYKANTEKKQKVETPVVMRRSLRTRGLPPDLKGLGDDSSVGPAAVSESPKKDPKASPRNAEPISMDNAYCGSGSDHAFREIIMNFCKNAETGSTSVGGFDESEGQKVENLCDSAVGLSGHLSSNGNVKREHDYGDSVDVGLLRGTGDKIVRFEEFNKVKGCKQEKSFDLLVGASESSLNHNVKREDDDKALGSPTTAAEKVAKKENPTMEAKEVAEKEEFDGARVCKVEKFCDLNRNKRENLPLSLSSRYEGDDGALVDINSLTLHEKNVARVVPGRIMAIKFFPTPNMRMITVGNKLGNVGFWNMGSPESEDGIFLYHTHPGPVSGISISEFNLSKVM